MRKDILFLSASLAFLFACSSENSTAKDNSDTIEEGVTAIPFVGGSPVIFTEVDPVNSFYKDYEGDDPAWVEVYNISDTTVNLNGLYLTDTLSMPTKWKFGDVPVLSKKRQLIFLSGKDLMDYEAPCDSINMIGTGIWSWADNQNTPVSGTSFVEPYAFSSYKELGEDGHFDISAQMQYGENEELGWHSASLFVGTLSGNSKRTIDISSSTELLLKGFVNKDRILEIRLAQPDYDDYKGYAFEITGTGDSTTVYKMQLPKNTTYPDLKNIYGTRFAPGENEMQLVAFKFTDFIARYSGHYPHAGFKIKNNGGRLYLIGTDSLGGFFILDSLEYPVLPVGKSFARNEEGIFGFSYPTPLEEASGLIYPVQAKTLELPKSGFFTEPFYLTFEGICDACVMRCETGGALPTENSPVITPPALIDSTTVLRCQAYQEGALPGDVFSRTYMFETKPSIATVFLTGEPGAWFDPDTGIYMEGNNASSVTPHFGANYWQDKEIPIHIDFFEATSTTPDFSEDCGYEIFGNYSRANAKKSAAIIFRESYGKKRLEYPLFPEYPSLTSFKHFLLRNNGGNFGLEYFRDRFASSMSKGLGVDYQKGRPAVVFYNGEYYGIHNIRERNNKYYYETNYGYDPENISILDASNSVSTGSASDYLELINYLETNGCTSVLAYDYVKSKMDVENFMNYIAVELFANNRDWPSNNLKKWRSSMPSTLWKWFLYDLDFGLGNSYSEYTNNIFDFATTENGESWPNGPSSTFLLRTLLQNEEFKSSFINRFAVLLSTKFSADALIVKYNNMYAEISAEIARDQKRFSHSANFMQSEENKTYTFLQKRADEVYKEMEDFFELGKITPVEISVVGNGSVLVHGLQVPLGLFGNCTVSFFAGFSVTVSALPSGASVFSRWSDGNTDPVRVIDPALVSVLQAEFK